MASWIHLPNLLELLLYAPELGGHWPGRRYLFRSRRCWSSWWSPGVLIRSQEAWALGKRPKVPRADGCVASRRPLARVLVLDKPLASRPVYFCPGLSYVIFRGGVCSPARRHGPTDDVPSWLFGFLWQFGGVAVGVVSKCVTLWVRVLCLEMTERSVVVGEIDWGFRTEVASIRACHFWTVEKGKGKRFFSPQTTLPPEPRRIAVMVVLLGWRSIEWRQQLAPLDPAASSSYQVVVGS